MNITAAKQLSPEKLTEVLTKIHKGATGSLTMSQIQAVVEHFGGSITPLVVLQPIEEFFMVTGESLARLSAYKVSSLPSNPKKDQVFITKLPKNLPVGGAYDTDPGSSDPLKAFVSVSAVKVSLGGKTGLVEGRHNNYLLRSISQGIPGGLNSPPAAIEVIDWLKKEGGLKKLVDDELGGEHIPAAKRTRDNTGHCAVCLQNVKLKSDTLTIVSHGYTILGYRPPGERTQGICPGTGYPPYELSDEGSKARIKVLTRDEDLFERHLGSLDSTTNEAYKIRADLKWVKSEITRMEGLVKKWKVRPLPVEGGLPLRLARMASRVASRFLNQ